MGAGRDAEGQDQLPNFADISPDLLLHQQEFEFVQPEIYTEGTVGFFCAGAKANANTAFSLKEY